jgi:palmitoyl-protein thioesterase
MPIFDYNFGLMQDKLGLKTLKESGRLHFLQVDGDHLRFKMEWFLKNIADPYLKNSQ